MYTSVNNEKIKYLKKLQNKKYRRQTGEFLVEGDHLVKEAYNAGLLKELYVEQDNLNLDVKTYLIDNKITKYLSGVETPTGIFGLCQIKENKLKGSRLLILDNISDPGNLGTIIRSSVAFNIDTIVLSKDTVDPYNSKVIRASEGMIFHINIITEDLFEFIPKIKGKYPLYGTKVDGGKPLDEFENKDKFAIIMGNEGNGVKEEILNMCDEYMYIPMNQNCESLNVAVATSIILYKLR